MKNLKGNEKEKITMTLSQAIKQTEDWIKAELANDEASTDSEMIKHLVANGINFYVAQNWVQRRQEILKEIYNGN